MRLRSLLFPIVGAGLLLGRPFASPGATVVLVAGGNQVADNIPATDAKLSAPFGVDFDRAGNLVLVEMIGERVRRIDNRGFISTLAGTGVKGFGGDGGPASAAQFAGNHNLAIAPNGDVYLADTWNSRVRKIDAKTGFVSTIAGTGTRGFRGDGGPAAAADFGNIYCASLDPGAAHLYLADLDHARIRSVDLLSGIVRTVAGNGRKGVPSDGARAIEAPLVDPRAVIADGVGNIYVLERGGHALRRVDPAGRIRTLVGPIEPGTPGEGAADRSTRLNGPKHLCFDLAGNVIIADTENHLIRKYRVREGRMETVAGTGHRGSRGVGGPPDKLELNQPHGVYMHPDGVLFICDSSNNRILKLVP